MQERLEEKRDIRRRRTPWLRNFREWFNCSSSELVRVAVNKVLTNSQNGYQQEQL